MVMHPAGGGTARSRARAPPFGLLFVPFLIGVAGTLLVALAMGWPTRGPIMGLAFLIGAGAAALVLGRAVARTQVPPLPVAQAHAAAAPPDVASPMVAPGPAALRVAAAEDREPDPLRHIQAVEDQGRRLKRDCVNCGTAVAPEAEACPSCGHRFMVKCKGCQTQVRVDWSHCPECGRQLS